MANKTLLEKVAEGRQYRSMQFECRKSENDKEDYTVVGYASTFNEPYNMGENDKVRVLEQVDARAFDECQMDDVIFQYDHVGRVFARLSNKTMELDIDNHGLKVTAHLGGTEEGRKLYEEIKGGYTTRMSFGFIVGDDEVLERKADDGKVEYLRTLKKITKLFDVSAVSLPANDGTEISARAFCDGVFAEVEKRALEEEEKAKQQKEEEERLAEEKSKLKKRQREKEKDLLSLCLSHSSNIIKGIKNDKVRFTERNRQCNNGTPCFD